MKIKHKGITCDICKLHVFTRVRKISSTHKPDLGDWGTMSRSYSHMRAGAGSALQQNADVLSPDYCTDSTELTPLH
jgi:hypothetical protein